MIKRSAAGAGLGLPSIPSKNEGQTVRERLPIGRLKDVLTWFLMVLVIVCRYVFLIVVLIVVFPFYVIACEVERWQA